MLDDADILTDYEQLRSRYHVLRHLGDDGGSSVYAVRGRDSDRHYLVKVMRKPGTGSARTGTLHLWQAHTMERLDHPKLIALHTVNHLQGGTLALAMERRRGPTLAEKIALDGPLPIAEFESTLRDVAEALAYLHARGVVHRGVNPDSIVFDLDTASVRLAHFGIPRGARAGEISLDADASLRRALRYESPEQRGPRSDAVGPRSDLYSLGRVAYLMLTGRVSPSDEPLEASSQELLESLETLRPDAPPHLCRAIAGCVDRDPRRRWRSVEELLGRLDPEAEVRPAPSSAGPDIRDWLDQARAVGRTALAERARSVQPRALALSASLVVVLVAWAAWPNAATPPAGGGGHASDEVASSQGAAERSGPAGRPPNERGEMASSGGDPLRGPAFPPPESALDWEVAEPVEPPPSRRGQSIRELPRAGASRRASNASPPSPTRESLPFLLGEELASADLNR